MQHTTGTAERNSKFRQMRNVFVRIKKTERRRILIGVYVPLRDTCCIHIILWVEKYPQLTLKSCLFSRRIIFVSYEIFGYLRETFVSTETN